MKKSVLTQILIFQLTSTIANVYKINKCFLNYMMLKNDAGYVST